jgi:hypothetical protein
MSLVYSLQLLIPLYVCEYTYPFMNTIEVTVKDPFASVITSRKLSVERSRPARTNGSKCITHASEPISVTRNRKLKKKIRIFAQAQ